MKIKCNIILTIFAALMILSGCGDTEPEYVDISVQHVKTKLASGGVRQITIQKSEYEKLAGMDGVVGASLYGQSSEISYYYQEGEDYNYNMSMSGDEALDRIRGLKDNQKIKSASLLAPEDLEAGKFPEHTFDVVMYSGDEELIGQEFLIYFKGTGEDGTENCIGFKMRISGIQTMEENQLFFSEDFCRQMGMWIRGYSGGSVLLRCVQTGGDYGIYSGAVCDKEYRDIWGNEDFLFFDDTLNENEIVVSDMFLAAYGPIMDSVQVRYAGLNGLYEEKETLTVKRDLFQGSSGMRIVSKEFYENLEKKYGEATQDSFIIMLRVKRDKADRICRELTQEGYEGIVWE